MTVKFTEDRKNRHVYVKINSLEKLTRRTIRQGFFMLARDLKSTASENILKKPKGGRVYISRNRGGTRRRHKASSPGETHANRSGALRRSLGWRVTGSQSMEFGYGVDGPSPDYDKFVELGTKRMAPRPSLGIAVNQTNRNQELYFKQAWTDVMDFER